MQKPIVARKLAVGQCFMFPGRYGGKFLARNGLCIVVPTPAGGRCVYYKYPTSDKAWPLTGGSKVIPVDDPEGSDAARAATVAEDARLDAQESLAREICARHDDVPFGC